MGSLFRKLRGLAGLTVFGGAAGSVFGVLMGVVTSLFFDGGPLSLSFLISGAVPWAMIGGFSAAGVGLALAALDGRKSLGELSVGKAALFGAALGGGALATMISLIPVGLSATTIAVAAGFGAVLGGGIGGGAVAMAKAAEREGLDGSPARAVLPGNEAGLS